MKQQDILYHLGVRRKAPPNNKAVYPRTWSSLVGLRPLSHHPHCAHSPPGRGCARLALPGPAGPRRASGSRLGLPSDPQLALCSATLVVDSPHNLSFMVDIASGASDILPGVFRVPPPAPHPLFYVDLFYPPLYHFFCCFFPSVCWHACFKGFKRIRGA